MRPTTFKVDNTIYWSIRTYTDAGVLVDADSTPTVAVRKNGASVADSVTVTKRAATTGIYDCYYNPSGETEGDCFTLEETATVSAQAYENAWSIEAQAAERGTDSAALATDLSDVDTKVDSLDTGINDIQSGVDNISTPADIYAYFVDGNRDDAFKADVTNLANESTQGQLESNQQGILTILNSIVLPNQATIATRTLSIEAVTNKLDTALQQDGSDYQFTADALELAPTGSGGGGGDSASTIYSYFTSSNREDVFQADVSGLSTFDPSSDVVTTDAASRNASKADVSGLASQSTSDAIESKVDGLVADSSGWDTADISGLATQASVDILSTDLSDVDTKINLIDSEISTLAKESSVDDLESDVTDIKNTMATVIIPAQVAQGNAIASVEGVTDKLETMLQADGSNFQYTVDSLALAPTGSGGGGSGDSAATIYNYFTTNSREDAFKADVSDLATSSEVTLISVPSEADMYNYFTSGSREDQFKADTSSLATTANVTAARSEIVADIAALNDFDPSSDTVARVTLVDTTTDLTNQSGGGGGGDATSANQSIIIAAINDLNDFDPDNDVVQNVQTVQTVINGGGGGGGGGSITVKASPTPRAF